MSGPQQDFAGKNGQVWFVGIVESRDDPAMVGRMKVRIFGWHDEDSTILPTEKLPWAQISLPANNSRASSLPKEGEWVHGFFIDGYAGQQPLILGVIPGILSSSPVVIPNGPTTIPGVVLEEQNKPSVPALARETIENTGIAVSNQNLIHVCDVVAEMDLDIAELKLKVGQFISQVRIALEALFDGLSLNPSSEGLKQQAEAIKSKIKTLQRLLKDINDELAAVQAYIKYLQDLIDYINNLPAEIQKFLSGCLSQATKDLAVYNDKLKTLQNTTASSAVSAAVTGATTILTTTENTTTANSSLGTLA